MAVDPARRNALLRKIRTLEAGRAHEAPAIPLAEFLDGNDDDGSLSVNAGYSLERWRKKLESIARNPDVHSIYALIVDSMEDDEDSWPYSDTLLVYTKAVPEVVGGWFGPMAPDEVDGIGGPGPFPGAPPVPSGFRIVRCWWD